ncbi:MAG: protein kinase [Acidobacteriota bacterium]|nr:protein kinase [Acidobacteriota bacterium]
MKPDPLIDTAGRVADFAGVDWDAAFAGLSADDRAVADQLVAVSQVAAAHRQLHDLLPGDPSSPADDRPVASRWGHLELLEQVGRGSFGIVYRALDTHLHREVALKLFPRSSQPATVIEEGRRLARVRHPNVVTVFGADVHEGLPGIWMEFVRGKRLDLLVKEQGRFGAHEAALIGRDLCRALAAIHAAGLVHRDVKAQNVMREAGGRIVLMDLGASSVLLPGDAVADQTGTPLYMAPEVLAGTPATPESDVYSLGVTLFYLATGQFPIAAASLAALRQAHLDRSGRNLLDVRADLAPEFVRAVSRAVEHDPARRTRTAGEFEADLSDVLSISVATAADPVTTGRGWRGLALWLAAALAVVLSGAAITRFTSVEPSDTSIAVLPILNRTGNPDLDYLTTGMTELLISNLARIRSLRVPSYDAVRNLSPTAETDGQASRLGVRLLLAGSLDQVNDGFRLSVRLSEPATGKTIWGDEIIRDRAGIISAQSEISRLVATRLMLDLSPGERRALAERVLNPEAQDAYVRGLVETTIAFDDRRATLAASLFKRAIELEPTFAEAWAELALIEHRLADLSALPERAPRIEHARELARRSLSLDPELPVGLTALATVQFYFDWDLPLAEETYRQAIASSPSYALARQRLAMLLAAQGRFAESIAMGLEAREREPLIANRTTSVATLYYYARDFGQAESEMRRALSLSPGYGVAHFGLGRIYSARGLFDAAIAEIQQALAQSRNVGWLSELARVYLSAGRQADAGAVMQELETRRRAGETPGPDSLAYLAVAEGRHDDALAILEEAVVQRSTNALWLGVDPRVDPLRTDPRFGELLRRAGLGAQP